VTLLCHPDDDDLYAQLEALFTPLAGRAARLFVERKVRRSSSAATSLLNGIGRGQIVPV